MAKRKIIKEKKEPLIDQSTIGVPPRASHIFLWADYVELLCLTSIDKIYSNGNFKDPSEEDNFSDEHLEISVNEDIPDGYSFEEIDFEDVGSINEDLTLHKDDKIERKWADISFKLNFRQKTLVDMWPFKFEDDVLTLNFDRKNPYHYIYVFLLMSSQLRMCNDKRRHALTGGFESLSFYLFRCLLPKGWMVEMTGAKASTGKIYPKLKLLSEKIRSKLVVEEDDYHPNDIGDGKLDLIAWHPMEDSRSFIPISIAQCGCSPTDWESKQLETSNSSLSTTFNFLHPPANYFFMPHDLMKSEEQWDRRSKIVQVVMVDRTRLLRLSKFYMSEIRAHAKKHELFKIRLVKEVLAYERGYFD